MTSVTRSMVVAVVLTAALHDVAAAQLTGRIEGRVIDAATGEGLVGGQVVIAQTALGNVTRADGSFFIERVPVGVQSLQTEYLGYAALSLEARVLPGRTTRLDFAMSEAVIETAAIVATISHEPWIPGVTLPPRPVVHSLPEAPPAAPPLSRCEVTAVLHGAYIQDGKWQMQTSVGALRCWSEKPEPEISACNALALELTPPIGPDTFHHAPGAQGSDLPTPSGPEGSSGT